MMQIALLLGVLHTAASAWMRFGSAWESVAQWPGSILVTSIWQSAVIVCALEIAMRLMPRVSAAHRFAAWATGFGLAVALPVLALMNFGQAASSALDGGSGMGGASPHALWHLDARWGLAIAGIWAVASLIRASHLTVHSVRLRRLWKAARPMEVSVGLSAAVTELRGGVEICTTEMLDRPSVIGFLAPRILIPDWLMARVSEREFEQIVLHEAEHLRRRDDWTNLLQKICLVAFPLNPGLAWMERRLCGEREMACDEGVVRITNAPRAYAACLASLAERGLERRAEALSLGAWRGRSELVRRVHRILLRKHGMSKAASGAVLGVLACMLIAGSVEMARCPQLVAFVSRQNEVAMTPERQQQLAALLAREHADSRMVLPTNFHPVQAKAVLPSTQVVPRTAKRGSRQSALQVQAKIASGGAKEIAMTKQSGNEASAVAGDRVNRDPIQQWVVLAAVEEVQTVKRSTGSESDYGAEAVCDRGPRIQSTASAAAAGKRKAAGRAQSDGTSNAGGMENQYTITRLLLRVVPANPGSTQPTSVHGGWLVFQL
jgi:beta-lactamase regulating signal transducer with metallopeptidase domain